MPPADLSGRGHKIPNDHDKLWWTSGLVLFQNNIVVRYKVSTTHHLCSCILSYMSVLRIFRTGFANRLSTWTDHWGKDVMLWPQLQCISYVMWRLCVWLYVFVLKVLVLELYNWVSESLVWIRFYVFKDLPVFLLSLPKTHEKCFIMHF